MIAAPHPVNRRRAYFSAEKAVGRKKELLMLAMIGPSISLSSRTLSQAGSAANVFHFFSRSASDSQASKIMQIVVCRRRPARSNSDLLDAVLFPDFQGVEVFEPLEQRRQPVRVCRRRCASS